MRDIRTIGARALNEDRNQSPVESGTAFHRLEALTASGTPDASGGSIQAAAVPLTNTANVADDATLRLDGPYALTTVNSGGNAFVVAAGNNDSGVTVLQLVNGASTPVFSLADSADTHLLRPLSAHAATVAGVTYVYISGDESGFSAFRLEADGSLNLVQDVADTAGSALATSYFGITSAEVGGTTYLYVSSWQESGITAYSIGAGGALTQIGVTLDGASAAHRLFGVAQMVPVTVGGNQYLLASATFENAVNVLRINAGGTLTFVSAVVDDAALEISFTYTLTTAVVGGATYVYAAGLDDSGLSVFSLDAAGTLTNLQNVSDDAASRLSGAITLTAMTANGLQYLAVGGGENGVTLFLIGGDGRLSLDQVIDDSATTFMRNEAHVASIVADGTTYLVTTGFGDDGVSVFQLAPPAQNTAPVANPDFYSTAEDTPVQFAVASLTANDTDADGDTITLTGAGPTQNGTFTSDGGIFTFTPNQDFVGDATFDYEISDGNGGTSVGRATITVSAVNDAPVVDLDPAAGGNDNVATYTEQAPVVTLASGIVIADVDSATLTGASGASSAARSRAAAAMIIWASPGPGRHDQRHQLLLHRHHRHPHPDGHRQRRGLSGGPRAGHLPVDAERSRHQPHDQLDGQRRQHRQRRRDDGPGRYPVNDAPAIAGLANFTVAQTEGAFNGSGGIAPNAIVSDADSADFSGGTLTVAMTSAYNGRDTIGILGNGIVDINAQSEVTVNGVAIGSLSGGYGTDTLTIVFNGNATAARVQELMRAIYVQEQYGELTGGTRTFAVTLTDGDGGTTPVYTGSLVVTAVNDEPAGTDNTITINEDTAYTLTVADFGFSNMVASGFPEGDALAAVFITVLADGRYALSRCGRRRHGLARRGGDHGRADNGRRHHGRPARVCSCRQPGWHRRGELHLPGPGRQRHQRDRCRKPGHRSEPQYAHLRRHRGQ